MQNDEIIWQVINHQFCSYKSHINVDEKQKKQFCSNKWSISGLCNRGSCPLANSKYATVREQEGKIYLYIKTVERAHTPKDLWEPILLSRNYSEALQQITEHLQYFPKVIQHKNKQRLTKIHQYLLRMRKLKLKSNKPKLVGINKKVEIRENRREVKALKAAKVDHSIEAELVERLKKGTYGDIYNFPEVPYQKALENVEESQSEEEEDEEEEEEEGLVEYVEDLEDEEEEEEEMEDMGIMYGGESSSEEEEESDNDEESSEEEESEEHDSDSSSDDGEPKKKPVPKKKRPSKTLPQKKEKKKSRKGGRLEIEYEEENEAEQEENVVAGMAW